MQNFDDIINNKLEQQPKSESNTVFDKEKWKNDKKEYRKQTYKLIDDTLDVVIHNSGEFQKFLDTQSKFDYYSVNNIFLILAQMPQATKIKDFNAWKDSGTFVRKQVKGIDILEPNGEYSRDDGSVGVNYTVKKMFDITQTKINALMPMQKNIVNDRLLIRALTNNPPVTITLCEKLPIGLGAFYDNENRKILLVKGMSATDIFRSLSSELAHAELAMKGMYDRATESFNAYCVSYILCKKNDMDVSNFDFSITTRMFEDMDAKEIKADLNVIRETAFTISSRMAKVFEHEKQNKIKENER